MASAEVVDPEAFRQLYPHDYLQRFLAQGIRSDGRPLGRSRALSCAPGVAALTTLAALSRARLGSAG
jgi:exosome complex component RRP43